MRPTTKLREKSKQAQPLSKTSKLVFLAKLIFIDVVSLYYANELKFQKSLKNEQRDAGVTFFWWAHISCAFWLPEIVLPRKAPIKLNRIDTKNSSCLICGQDNVGLTLRCQEEEGCDSQFHVECALKANYHLKFDKQLNSLNEE